MAVKGKIIFVSCLAVFFICCKTVAKEYSLEWGEDYPGELKSVIKNIQIGITCTDDSPCVLREFYENKSWEVRFVCKKLISFYYFKEIYSGGAHEYGKYWVGTFVRKTGKQLKLEDLFEKEQLPYVEYAIRYCLMKQKGKNSYKELRAELQADPKPTENFYFDEKGLHFLYPPYQIASFADGVIDVCIPWLFPNASWQPKNEKEALYGRIYTVKDLRSGVINSPQDAIRLNNQETLHDILEWTDVNVIMKKYSSYDSRLYKDAQKEK